MGRCTPTCYKLLNGSFYDSIILVKGGIQIFAAKYEYVQLIGFQKSIRVN